MFIGEPCGVDFLGELRWDLKALTHVGGLIHPTFTLKPKAFSWPGRKPSSENHLRTKKALRFSGLVVTNSISK